MNILIMGAGAIGSYFGGMLSKNNNVTFIARKAHSNKINKEGLKIIGKTNLTARINSFEKIDEISEQFDLIIISVKSFDTEKAIKDIIKSIDKKTIVMSLQNGLGNIEKISKYVSKKNIFACITSNGVIFEKPGLVRHTGVGYTKIGSIANGNEDFILRILKNLNHSGIKTDLSKDIKKEIWIKAIINSSINPLTTFFRCKNGYLIKNPILSKLVEKICLESTNIAQSYRINVEFKDMLERTMSVIKDTKENYSSMFQSYKNNKPLEIKSINGYFLKIAKEKNVDYTLNKLILNSISPS